MAEGIELAKELVPELLEGGAAAVVLTGSYARGDATDASNFDLVVVGEGPRYVLEVRDGVLVAESWASEDEHRSRLSQPAEVGSAVPGWREAVVLHDPDGVAVRLKDEALDWRWKELGDRCDAWVAEQVVGLAEEVQKLAAALGSGPMLTAAVQRDLLALRLAPILAVHHRLLSASENALWEQVGERMDEAWRRAQAAAFGTGGESFERSCANALRLFRLAVDCVRQLLDGRQLAVVGHALATAAPSVEIDDASPIIRRARTSDIPALSDLAKRTWADAFGSSVSPGDEAAELDAKRSETYFTAALREQTILVADWKDALLGYVQFGDVDLPGVEVQPGDQELHRLYVETELQGLGLGRTLMNAALRHPRLARASRVYLQVWERNEHAIRLYESLGFRTVSATTFTVGSGQVAEDLVMLLDRSETAGAAG